MADESTPVESGAVLTTTPTVGKRRSATGPEQERRVAWGQEASAKVAAAYKALEESGQS